MYNDDTEVHYVNYTNHGTSQVAPPRNYRSRLTGVMRGSGKRDRTLETRQRFVETSNRISRSNRHHDLGTRHLKKLSDAVFRQTCCNLIVMFARTAVLTAFTLTVAACGGSSSLKIPTQLQSTTSAPAPTTTVITTTTVSVSPVIVETIPSEVVVEPTTSTTTEVPLTSDPLDYIDEQRQLHGRCGEWHDLAMEVGWQESEWETLSTVLYTESRCTVDAWNGHDAGLSQINQIHKGWAAEMGFSFPDDLFNPANNLYFAYRLWSSREEKGLCGWKPWSEPCR